jgi:hypothetical protein
VRDEIVTEFEKACLGSVILIAILYLYRYIIGMDPNPTRPLPLRRDQILEEMRALDHMRRGSLSRQFFRSRQPHRAVGPGPYFVLQGYLQGQKFSRRVPADQAAAVEGHVANYQRFQVLAEEFVTVTEQLTLAEEPAAKKNSARRSTKSGSGKPRRSSA